MNRYATLLFECMVGEKGGRNSERCMAGRYIDWHNRPAFT